MSSPFLGLLFALIIFHQQHQKKEMNMLMKIAVLFVLLSSQTHALAKRPQPLVAKQNFPEVAAQLKAKILSGKVQLTCGVGSHG